MASFLAALVQSASHGKVYNGHQLPSWSLQTVFQVLSALKVDKRAGYTTMMFKNVVFLAAAVAAQTSMSPNNSTSVATATSTVFDEGVPTDRPVPGDYSGVWRPQVHFSPPTQFMNDPNGMFVDANRTYHLYYQCKSASFLPLSLPA
jgi:hypothetical protein